MKVIAIDFESFFSKKLKYTIKTTIAEQYCRHELFDCYIVSVSDGEKDWAGHPLVFNWQSLEGATIVSHNRYFDNTVYNELVRRGIAPQVRFAAWHCSADLTSYICNRRALSQAVEYLYKVKVSKAPRDTSDGKHWPQDFSDAERQTMLDYARGDARWCWRLWNDYSAQWPAHEQRLSNMTIEQGMRGVQIDTALLDTYLLHSHEMKLATEKLLPWLSDIEGEEDSWTDFNTKPTSTKCVAEQCRRAGIPCPPVKVHEGEEAYAEWEKTYSPRNSWIAALSSWRSINKLYKSFLTFKSRLRPDGTMPFGLKYFGAHTGRWSGDGGINFQNFRKKPILCNRLNLMETDERRIDVALEYNRKAEKNNVIIWEPFWPEWVKYSIDPRHLIIPRPGKHMILSDLSQIEPRCLAWIAGDEKLLALVRGGMSIYEAFARTAMGFTGAVMDKKSVFYAEVKARVLALGYGAGWEKYIEMTADYTGLDITANDPEWITNAEGKQVSGYGQRARSDVAEYRAQNPLVTGLWAKLDLAFKRCIGDKLEVVLPSGRKLRYEQVKAERRLKPDRETGKPKLSTVFTADIGGRRFETYGGKLTENLVQAFARDVFAEHLLRLEDAGLTVLFTSHDEAILEVEPGVTASDVAAVMSECPSWCKGLPVAAEAHMVSHYLK